MPCGPCDAMSDAMWAFPDPEEGVCVIEPRQEPGDVSWRERKRTVGHGLGDAPARDAML